MANIYTRAALVYVWLGDDNDSELHEDSRAAFKFMEKDVLNLKNFDKLVTDEKQHKDWHNMVELLKRESAPRVMLMLQNKRPESKRI